jgi:hypothetical protein
MEPTEPTPQPTPPAEPVLTPEEFRALMRRAPQTALRAAYLEYRREAHRRRQACKAKAAAGQPKRKRGRPKGPPPGFFNLADPPPPRRT